MMEIAKAILARLEQRITEKHFETLNKIGALKYQYNSDTEKTFLSGKVDAYEDVVLMIKEIS